MPKMTGRVNLRRGLAYLLTLTAIFVLFVNLQQLLIFSYNNDPNVVTRNDNFPSLLNFSPNNEEESSEKAIFSSSLNLSLLQERLWHRKLDLTPLDSADRFIPNAENRPWYMRKGQLFPAKTEISENGERMAVLLPSETVEGDDRIVDQMMFFPPNLNHANPEDLAGDSSVPLKTILLWNGVNSWGAKGGRGAFIKANCPVSSCALSTKRKDAKNADLVIFKDHFTKPSFERPKNQLWMMFMLESPLHTQNFKYPWVFNWTATYRSDSTIVAPYERWQYYNGNVRSVEQPRSYALNKTKLVAWFVSNCNAYNERLQYARELQKFITVDIFGRCGAKNCPRTKSGECFEMLDKDYKFYLAFENSNCKEYITEKFFVNGLGHDVLPIVMGARPEDYARSAPEKSYIHVDDFESPEHLAQYLHRLDQDDDLYNSYFQWKGTGEFLNTNFFCRVCAMLHDPKIYSDDYLASGKNFVQNMNDWWRGPRTCIRGSWRKYRKESNNDDSKRKEKRKSAKSSPINMV